MKTKGWGFLLCALSFNLLAQSQMELNQTACNELKQTDNQLNLVYQQVLKAHQNDKIFISHFKDAQRKWVVFRDASASSMYLPEYSQNYGSAMSMCQCYYLEKLTSERIKQLKVWIDGVQEGDVCVGSITQ